MGSWWCSQTDLLPSHTAGRPRPRCCLGGAVLVDKFTKETLPHHASPPPAGRRVGPGGQGLPCGPGPKGLSL